jgi:hypothetical protein
MSSKTSVLILSLTACALSAAAWHKAHQALHAAAVPGAEPSGDWINGTRQEQVKAIEKHLRGTDVAMMEVGYRFVELHYAGLDGNWDYAKYLAEKMDLATRLALERRPKRAKSAQPFLNQALPSVQKAIASRDRAAFTRSMEALRMACMKCHVDEKLPFFTVEMPERRLTTIRTER